MAVGNPRFTLGCTKPGEIKSEMSTVKHFLDVHDADRNDRDGAPRAGDAVHDSRVDSKRERGYEGGQEP